MSLPEQIAVGTAGEVAVASVSVGTAPSFASSVQDRDVEDLFAACMPRLAKTARRLVRNTEDSEDLLQDTLLSAFKNLHQFEGRSKFSTWLHSIVRNKAKMHLRKAGAHRCCSLEEVSNEHGELLLDIAPAVNPDAEDACLTNERSEILRRIVMRLSPGHRLVIQLCDIEGLDGRAAAARLGLTISGLKTRLHRARKSVTRKLAENLTQEQRQPESPTRFELAEAVTQVRPTPATLKGSGGELVTGRRAVGARHERAKKIRGYYCLPAERRVGACLASSAL